MVSISYSFQYYVHKIFIINKLRNLLLTSVFLTVGILITDKK